MNQASTGTVAGVPVAAGRKGFKAELDALREWMRSLGFSTEEIAAEVGCRYRASWARAFPGTPQHAGSARRFVAGLLDGSPFRDDAAVVLSELFTNALLHTASGGPGGLVIVQVTRWRHGVRIAVTDQGSSTEPVIRDPASAGVPAESGHGLYLAAQLAQRLDWHDDASGRTVAAVLGQPVPSLSGPSHARPGVTSVPVGAIGSAGG